MKLLNRDLLIIFALVVLLFGLSYHKIKTLKIQSHRAVTEKNLSAISDAIAVYRGDNEGKCPPKLEDLVPKYLFSIPFHNRTSGTKVNTVKSGPYQDSIDGNGGWIFVTDPKDDKYCNVFVNRLN